MDYQHYQKSTINSYYRFRLTSPFPTPSPLFLKIKYLLHAYIFRHTNCGIRALQNLKSTVDTILYKKTRGVIKYMIKLRGANNNKMKNTKAVNSITVHVNYSPLQIIPVADQAYYDADWNSIIPTDEMAPLSGYLEWLEDKSLDETTNDDGDDDDGDSDNGCDDGRDINRRAESFIARCYEKFRLEKQESYRRYHEMMARSL
ncbi:cotton fiber protein [Rhynchospora pubera]|uniref:Cotton fiber protein n=1 Tax=Rhynchospora pubera TaxID=906938 RepID=A0AAV8FF35_9POAL|nr:cotton fiber protein [Rhynchospora pubera]